METAQDKIKTISFDGAGLSSDESFSLWESLIETIFELDIKKSELENFSFSFSGCHLGSLVLGKSASIGHHFRRTQSTIARGLVDHYFVQVIDRGGFVGDADGHDISCAPGDVWIADLSRPVFNNSATFSNTTLVIPRLALAPHLKAPDDIHGLKLAAETPLAEVLRGHLRQLASAADRMTTLEATSVASSTLHLIAGCFGAHSDSVPAAREGLSQAKLSAIMQYIEANLSDSDLDAERICRRFHMSRAVLYRLFVPIGGVREWVRSRRLRRCFYEIGSPKFRFERISEIAYRWGFVNEAGFSRTFRATYGVSPSELRFMGHDAYRALRPTISRDTHSDEHLGEWIKGLMLV